MQEQLEKQLRVVKPDHSREDPFDIEDVYKAGCHIFNSNAFNRMVPSTLPTPVSSIQPLDVAGDPKVVKKVVQLPLEQPSYVMDLLDKLQSYRVEKEVYATMYFQIL